MVKMTSLIETKKLLKNRLGLILQLSKGRGDRQQLERELALLAFDLLQFNQNRNLLKREGCNCFKKIIISLGESLHGQLSEEALDVINEGLLLDEIGTKHGPDVELFQRQATRIIQRGVTDRSITRKEKIFTRA